MKLFIFIAFALMLVGMTAQAAEVPTSQGDKAMIFMFNGLDNLSLGTYGEYGVGMRYYFADSKAIRAGLTLGSEADIEKDDDWDEDREDTSLLIGLDAAYEMHMEGPCSSVSPYWGVGGSFWAETGEYKDEDGDTWTDTGVGFSGYGMLGFEWAFTNCMTLGGEYQAGLWAAASESENPDGDTYGECGEGGMGFSAASVYLSVYF